MEKSDIVNRKYVDIVDVNDYEVWTDSGWEDIASINKTVKYAIYTLATKNHQLKCADDHIVFDSSMNEIFVKDLMPGQLIVTEEGIDQVVSVTHEDENDYMYDLSLSVGTSRRFFTNGILSHNSTIYCIYACWLTQFFPEKAVMILANKAATSIELVQKISDMWRYLPPWLKSAAIVVNQGTISFSNKSSIRGFASSSDAARGFSANCVSGDTKVTVRLFKLVKLTVPIKYLRLLKYF